MPMTSKDPGKNISEFHGGGRYASAVRKYGKKHANEIAVAAGMSAARKAGAKGISKGLGGSSNGGRSGY